MTTLTWPEPEHGYGCCLKTPWDDPDPECPGKETKR
jgi:hypothetical protein